MKHLRIFGWLVSPFICYINETCSGFLKCYSICKICAFAHASKLIFLAARYQSAQI